MEKKKIQCLSCNSIFDDDYKRKHEIRHHTGKKMLTNHFGEPNNPFVAPSTITKQINTCLRLKTDIVSFYYYYFSVLFRNYNMVCY
jgi:hypothetical protein